MSIRNSKYIYYTDRACSLCLKVQIIHNKIHSICNRTVHKILYTCILMGIPFIQTLFYDIVFTNYQGKTKPVSEKCALGKFWVVKKKLEFLIIVLQFLAWLHTVQLSFYVTCFSVKILKVQRNSKCYHIIYNRLRNTLFIVIHTWCTWQHRKEKSRKPKNTRKDSKTNYYFTLFY